MLLSSMPTKFPIPFGNSAGGGFIRPIPVASQIGVNPGFASLTDGFVPLNFVPVAAGGIPPFGQDFNGILNLITKWSQWQAAGGAATYDAAFAAAIGGYPAKSVLASSLVFGNFWMSLADNNTTDPDSSGAANWVSPPGMLGTGWLGYTVFSTMPQGWVWAKASYTIGSGSSGASYASQDALPLFTALWNGFPNSQCPVSGGRGANPAADFAANKSIQVLDMSGTGIIGQDNVTGRLTGVPVTSGSANAPGGIIGENLHTLTNTELPGHFHNFSATSGNENANHTHTGSGTTGNDSPDHAHQVTNFVQSAVYGGGGSTAVAGPSGAITSGGATARHAHSFAFTTSAESVAHQHPVSGPTDSGSGGLGPHNTVDRNMTVNWILKL
jgi:hypothetical protein